VLTLRTTSCQFATKSGGHAAFAGASSIQNGVDIDLNSLKDIAIAKDKKTVRAQSGNLWYDVYSYLEPKGLTVIGGRVAPIGTGGLTLGGGISFWSSREGWACDNVAAYEVSQDG
jgi:FAD/FMN-containing dehydrogenase